jgi:hypothetical protein
MHRLLQALSIRSGQAQCPNEENPLYIDDSMMLSASISKGEGTWKK